jgi:endonuclease YncB( thermonuclease family)
MISMSDDRLASIPKRLLAIFCVATIALLTCGVATASTYSLSGKVVKVADGDTLTVLVNRQQHRIRLASIDAPETSHGSDKPGQPFGEAAGKYLSSLVAGKVLTLTCFEHDQYGREVCDVPVDATTANRMLVQSGYAWADQQAGGKYLRDKALPALQKQAQTDKKGLWTEPNAIPPWVWRYRCWKHQQC